MVKEETISENIRKDKETQVLVSFPNELKLELVQANELRHYELFQWLVALLLPIAIGFWTAYNTIEVKSSPLWWSALALTIVSCVFLGLAIYFISRVFHGSVTKSINLKDLK